MHPKLSHLSEEQIREIMDLYYDPEQQFTVSDIIANFKIDARPSEFASLLPRTTYEDCCPYCEGVHFQSKAKSRSSGSNETPTCPECGHKALQYCHCANCMAAQQRSREDKELRQRALIDKYHGPNSWSISLDAAELPLKDAIFLKAVIAHRASEDLVEIDPKARTQTRLAPGDRLIWDMLNHLYYLTQAIAPSAESDLSAFVFADDDDTAPEFYLSEVRWLLLPLLHPVDRLNYIKGLDARLRQLSESEDGSEEERSIWKLIVKYEALEYYEHKLGEVNIEIGKIGDRTHAVFDDLAERFSVAQIYHLVFVTVRNTYHYITQQGIPKYQAKNMFVGALERNANKYEAEGWLKEYRRDFSCPQSTLSAVFFDFYKGIGGNYFSCPLPSECDP